ncbi:hypothetical protein MGYG_01854 [Nannizzia gypsea CBS 118893]|uniref:Uncharacterized protein n=1 Tax=Arthroderma gypseum (strain ATCC MYA-4604 / CBS 118893) TaxID=535722 RepID=E5R3Z3_ARTGP|nr:hypothetical protein MGYG_01854 [Nannizzia gypsea CBS 118893]EFQ98839.1 hypothetical protein MGYG_01854 [Nannizzia gypsea CBS 118893]
MASPPPCLLGAVNTQGHPGDFETLCGDGSTRVNKDLVKLCGNDYKEALKGFTDACGEAGYKIHLTPISSSSSSSPSHTASSTGSMTTSVVSPTSTSGSGSSPSSGMGSSPSSTAPPNNVGALQKADSMFVALVVAIVGAIAL